MRNLRRWILVRTLKILSQFGGAPLAAKVAQFPFMKQAVGDVPHVAPTRTEGPAQASGSLATCRRNKPPAMPLEQRRKQLSSIGLASREMSLMLAIPYPKRSRTGFETAE